MSAVNANVAAETAVTHLRRAGHLPTRQGPAVECAWCGLTAVVCPELPSPHLSGGLAVAPECLRGGR